MSNLAAALYRQGKQREATELYSELLALYQRELGDSHPRTASAHAILGTVLGSGDTALEHLRAGLKIRQQALGPDHFALAKSLPM